VGDTTGELITEAIDFGISEGLSMSEIAKLVDQTAFGGGNAARAELIARTETIGALNQGEFNTAGDSGAVAGKEWLTQGDDRVRDDHFDAEAEGMIALEDRFDATDMLYPGDPEGDADQVCNCFLPGTLIAGNVIAAMRSRYRGPARELVTASGRRLSVTPNHPILTAEGLRPAWTIRQGDKVVGDRRQIYAMPMAAHVDDDERPACIEDVFAALREGATAFRRHLRSGDLHGDARWADREVEIVRADRMLLADEQPAGTQQLGERVLETVSIEQTIHARPRATDLDLKGVDLSAPAIPRRGALALDRSGVALECGPFQSLCIATSADLNAALLEAANEHRTGEAGFVRELLQGHARLVELDEVIEVRDFEFVGHVYDVEVDAPNILMAGGIASSNCRCTLLFYDTLEEGASSIENAGEAMSIDGKTITIRGIEYALLPLKALPALPSGTNGTH
jgi:hypothetical protein